MNHREPSAAKPQPNSPSPLYSGERVGVRGLYSPLDTPSPPTPLPRVQGRGEKSLQHAKILNVSSTEKTIETTLEESDPSAFSVIPSLYVVFSVFSVPLWFISLGALSALLLIRYGGVTMSRQHPFRSRV